jgi:hypothetical protein
MVNNRSSSGEFPQPAKAEREYFPPLSTILEILKINHTDLSAKSVSVSAEGLKYLIVELLKQVEVDEAWYLEEYPDVRAATLSGDIPSAAAHFSVAGYFEGRRPYELQFDPCYYFKTYGDLDNVFDASDFDGLRNHYETKGYYEGRAGVAGHFAGAERWRSASRGKR